MNVLRDARFGLRQLLKNPGFAIIAVLGLALGIGPNTAIFSFVYATLLAPLPYPHPDELVMVWLRMQGNRNSVSAGDFLDWRQQASCFQELSAFTEQDFNLSSSQQPERVDGQPVSPNWFKMLGDKVWLGREFHSDEDQPGKDHVAIISHRMWASKFGADLKIIGKQIRLNSEPYTVIGVLPPGRWDRRDEEIWVPMRFKPEQINHDFHWLLVLGRLKSGVSIEQAQQEMNAVTHHIAELYPKSNNKVGASVEPLKNDFLSPNTRSSLWLLLGAVGFVLLIASVNVANLLLARGTTRQREIAVRASLGASGRQLFLQLLTESVTLASVGGVLGIALSWGLLKSILAVLPASTLPSEADVRLSSPVLVFTIVTTMLAGVLFGCAPAWQARNVDLNGNLKQGGRSSVSVGGRGLRRGLVVAEFALALALLAGAGLAVHSFVNRTHVDLGIHSDHVLTFYLPVPENRFQKSEQIANFYRELLTKIEAVPGVSSTSVATGMPLQGTGFGMWFSVAGQTVTDPASRPSAGFEMVSPGYFQTFGVRLVRGRAFTQQDTASSPRVAMVSETFAARYLKGRDPLSQRVVVNQLLPGVTNLGPLVNWQIVGVFHDVQNGGPLGDPTRPEIDVPFAQSLWPQAGVAVRTALNPANMKNSIAAAVHSLDPNLPMADVKTMDQVITERLASDRFGIVLYGSLAGVALVLAALGIYGVMAFTVAQRTPEIGLRRALGAGNADLILNVLQEGLYMAGGGLLLGLFGAYGVGRAMRSMLYGTGTMDWAATSAVAAILLTAALVACFVPARRASAVDPMIALRQE